MKTFLYIILLLFLAFTVSAQEKKCDLALSEAPAIFNLKLGMSGAEARKALGGKLNIKNKKEGTFFQNFIKKSPPANLNGVRAIYLRFFASKIYRIEIFYENENAGLEDFLLDFSRKKNLPVELWQIEYGIARIKCEDFSLEIDNYLNPRVELTDENLAAEFEKAQEN